ncbi:unnamed protein product, partial [Onchocerca flexuosa]|uniref:Uncharacterized protein n=1 Tax=Onchocerca flexuosa TaxID=387005 RepID=A0A183HV83_9BILA
MSALIDRGLRFAGISTRSNFLAPDNHFLPHLQPVSSPVRQQQPFQPVVQQQFPPFAQQQFPTVARQQFPS